MYVSKYKNIKNTKKHFCGLGEILKEFDSNMICKENQNLSFKANENGCSDLR